MKKFLIICLTVFLLGGIIKYNYITNKCKNIDYAVDHYFTTGIFNGNKMFNVETIDLSFSNGNIAVVKIDGTAKKAPHKKVAYSVFLEKSSSGIWKVKKVYPSEATVKKE